METWTSWPARAPTSIRWPSPPRRVPGPPESGRSSFLQITAGPACSVASTGMVITPEGKAVASSPSRPGRAPEPPELKSRSSARRASAGASAPGWSESWKLHSAPAPSAGTRSGRSWSSAPNTTSGTMWPMTWRSATGAGGRAFTIVPSGAVTVKGASDPALLGTSGATAHLSA